MSGFTAWDASDEISAELALVRNSVACELDAQLGLRGEVIVLEDVCEVAYAVAVRLGHGFRIEHIAPPQPERPEDDWLGLDAAVFRVSMS
jgi:hypothetical protein